MSSYDFELNDLTFSFSSISTFENCNFAFKLTYIDLEERIDNFFGEFGSFIHDILEKYWKGELEKNQLSSYFEENYYDTMQTPPPPFPENMEANYYRDAFDFFEKFSYNRDDWEILSIEREYRVEHNGFKLVFVPDLILRERSTSKIIMFDFKTSKPIKGKKQVWDEGKIVGYRKQALLYAYFYEKTTGTKIDEIRLLFVRLRKEYVVEITEEETKKVLEWVEKTIQLIRWEEDFEENVDPYFCQNICSVRHACPFWEETRKPKNFYDYEIEKE